MTPMLHKVPKTPTLASQRTPKDFRNPTIKTDRRLRRDPAYKSEFPIRRSWFRARDFAFSGITREFNAVKRRISMAT